jgi:hypothetical protein
MSFAWFDWYRNLDTYTFVVSLGCPVWAVWNSCSESLLHFFASQSCNFEVYLMNVIPETRRRTNLDIYVFIRPHVGCTLNLLSVKSVMTYMEIYIFFHLPQTPGYNWNTAKLKLALNANRSIHHLPGMTSNYTINSRTYILPYL